MNDPLTDFYSEVSKTDGKEIEIVKFFDGWVSKSKKWCLFRPTGGRRNEVSIEDE